MIAIKYATVGSNQLERAKAFYDALFDSVGVGTMFDHPSGGRIYGQPDKFIFGVLKPYDGNDATVGNGAMVGFCFDTPAEVDAFHAKALELGGSDEGAPGERAPKMYFSYLRDPDGNKLCAYCMG